MTTTPKGTAVGHRVPRVDARQKVSGGAMYAADLKLEGVLWAKTVRSPHPHARIVKIDASAAVALPGVRAVVTGNDIPPGTKWGRRIADVPVLAQGEVKFAGEQVAAVIADDEETAERGVGLVEVEYEELPALLDPEEAMKDGAPLVNPNTKQIKGMFYDMPKDQNHFVVWEWKHGDIAEGFKQADRIIEHTYTTPNVHQAYMEAHNQTTYIDKDGVYHVWAPVKAPYAVRSQTANAIGVPTDKIVVHPVTIGGDFGGKGSPMNIPLGYYLNKAVGKPVRMIFDYTEEFMAANPRHRSTLTLRTGVKNDGTMVAHEARVVYDSGAYAGFKPAGHLLGTAGVAGSYRIPNTRVVEYMVYTNNPPCGHMRGPGEPQALWALESHIDEIAHELGIDPADYRLAHMARDGEPTALGEVYEENRGRATLELAIQASGYRNPKPKRADGWLIGRGIAVGERSPGGGQNNSQVTLHPDGTVSLETPLFDQGAGGVTVVAQMVAETMGLPFERVVVNVMETGLFENDNGIGGSRVTNIAGIATNRAVVQAQGELFKLAAELDNWPEDKLEIKGDAIVRKDTGASKPWKELLQRVQAPVRGRGMYEERGSEVTGFCVQIAEVAVDPESGQVKLLRMTSSHDTAQIVNPMGHQGQINGGMVTGFGYGVMEELKLENGRFTTLSFADFKIPTMYDIPEMSTVFLPMDSKGVGPYNIKAIGETPNAPTAPAIANAVADAVGVRVRDLPISAEKVFEGLQAKG